MNAKTDSAPGKRGYALELPLDASGIEDFKPDHEVKVAIQDSQGTIQSKRVKFDSKGRASARFGFTRKPGRISVAVGPGDAEDDEIFGLQTLRSEVPTRLWKEPLLVLPPLRIPPYHWHWWWRWCRNFTVRGFVLCPDGKPVPGAKVCAYDVDSWWWYSSKQQVGCATTDKNGIFEIKFRWCCGWWPRWWWFKRLWHLEPYLLERIAEALQNHPPIGPIPLPDPVPDWRVFERILGDEKFAELNLTRHLSAAPSAPVAGPAPEGETSFAFNPDMLEDLREPLLERLPRIPELDHLRLWPWWPWHPWRDCTPDLIFRVTQECEGQSVVIVDEDVSQTRWNVPTNLDVLLTANDEACCLEDDGDDPDGACALLSNVCHNSVDRIGGNPGAAAAPVGYLSPNSLSTHGDRPFGGQVLISGQVGDEIDYYEFQISSDGGVTWNDMPTESVGNITRKYWIPAANSFHPVSFLDTIDGRLVYETRRHYEDTHDPGEWWVTRFWTTTHYHSLMRWFTENPYLNGTYRLRIKGWKLVGGHLTNPQSLDFLPTCSLQTPAELVLRIDNRIVGAGSGHVMSDPDHPCGPGTIHTCTREPDTDFLGVRIVRRDANKVPTGEVVPVDACGNVPIGDQDLLQVDFFAHDPEGHLAYFTLLATYRENLAINLLNLPGRSLKPQGGAPVAAAAQVGPSYAQARSALPGPLGGAVAPTWNGGAMRFEVLAKHAFPETCCYQLELRAHKRTVVHCNHGLWGHTNYSQYGFMIVV